MSVEDATANIQPAFFQLYQHMLCSGFNQFISRGGCNDFFGNAYTLFKNCIIWKFAAVFCFKNLNCNRTIYRSCFQQHVVGDLISKEWPGLTPCIHIDPLCIQQCVYGDNVFEKDGIRRDRTGDGEKTRCLCGKRGIFNRDGPAMGPQIIRQLE